MMEEYENLESVKKGFSVSLSLLILYLAIFGLDKRLAIIWLLSMPIIFLILCLYDHMRGKELFERGVHIDLYMAVGGPFTVVGFIVSLYFLLKEIRNEKYEEPISEERDGDSRHDESREIRGKQKEEKPSQGQKSS